MKIRDFASDAEVVELVTAFENATIPAKDFTHLAHIAVALAYLEEMPQEQALERMREKIRAFAEHHAVGNLYHETLTTFWMKLLAHLDENLDVVAERPLKTTKIDPPLWQRINAIAARWGNRGPVDAHYSPEVIKSDEARGNWVPPDRLPTPF